MIFNRYQLFFYKLLPVGERNKKIMDYPEQYMKINSAITKDAIDMISKYLNVKNWKEHEENILDIGCGPAGITWEILRPNLPKGTKIFGADISDKMIKYASEKYPEIEFLHLDITKKVPENLRGAFNHIFSNYCLHWSLDQRQTMKNLNDLLKPNGDLLVIYLLSHPFAKSIDETASMQKWREYSKRPKCLADFDGAHPNDVKKQLRNILKDEGFRVSVCEVIPRKMLYPNIKFVKDLLYAINPHMTEIPQNLREQFAEEAIQYMIEDLNLKDGEEVVANYNIIVINATKMNSNNLN